MAIDTSNSFITHDANTTTFRYVSGREFPSIRLWWVDDQDTLINFASGYTFSLTVSRGSTTYITKTTGFTGAAGSGTPDSGTPNLTIAWNSGELDSGVLNAGVYRIDLVATFTSSSKERFQTFTLVIDSPSDVTWNYTGNPADSNRDAVRYLLGDTDYSDQLLSDQEIDWLLTENGTVRSAAAEGALSIAARFARCMDRSIGSLSFSFTQRFEQYQRLAEELRRNVRAEPAAAWFSGSSRSEKRARDENTDRERTFATKGIHDYYGTSTYNPDDPVDYGR
jgi:hypothetical protein